MRALGLCSAALIIAACGGSAPPAGPDGPDTSNTPAGSDVAGSYVASTFTTQDSTGVTDQIGRGASIELVLDTSGVTSGRLFVPGGSEDGSDFDADLEGTWTLRADTVEFNQTADTFIRDMPFLFLSDSDGLSGEETFGGTLVRVVLAKQ